MKLREANPKELADRGDRAAAKLARIARNDTVYGGARALVLASRLDRLRSTVPARAIVGDVYGASNYSCGEWGAYCCPECGQVHLGTVAAFGCCAEREDGDSSICDECGATIPPVASTEINGWHAAACSLHPSNVVDSGKGES